MLKVAVMLAAMCGLAAALVTGYHVEPVKAAWSGWTDTTPGHDYVSEVITCNFDELDSASGAYAELFVGSLGANPSNPFKLDVYEVGGVDPIASNQGRVATKEHSWLRLPLTVDSGYSFTKGKRYEFRFTRSGSDSIEYYYDEACGYHYGQMIAPYPPMITPDFGLAMRCYGRMNTVSDTDFGLCLPAIPGWWEPPAKKSSWTDSLTASDAGWATLSFEWNKIETMPGSYVWTTPDNDVGLVDTGIEPVAILVNCPRWASTAMESVFVEVRDTFGECLYYDTLVDTSVHCPPINLLPVNEDSVNYFARWVDAVVDRYGGRIHKWLVWNEPNDTCRSPIEDITGWWRRPWWHYQLGEGSRPLCSLYIRLCWVADSVIKAADSTDRVLIGNMHRVRKTSAWDPDWLMAGADWLDTCYEVAGSAFWDGVAFHAYQGANGYNLFDPDTFAVDVDTLRAIMRGYGDYGELWNTEAGWGKDCDDSVESRERAARNLCQTLVCTEASDASPSGACDRSSWWFFWENNPKWGHEPLLNDSFYRRPAFYAFKQACTSLIGKRFNGQVMVGDTAVDNHTWMYEFEDATALKKRTWVCWRSEVAPAATPVPVRNDTVDTVALDYDGAPPTYQKDAEQSGWLHLALLPRPVFVMEKSAASRPDLEVDSVKYVLGAPDTVLAWVTNRGTRATPRQLPGNQPYPTWAVLYANGDSLAQQIYADTIAVSQQVTFRFSLSIAQPAAVLLAVNVNPAQTYVELGTDDNSGYRLKVQQP